MVQRSIVNDIKQQIISGQLKPGLRMPPRTEFESRYRTTPNTIQRVFNRLAADGFIETVPRRGTFVSATPPHLTNYALLIYSKRVPGDWQNNFWDTLDRVASDLSRTTARKITVRPCIAPEFHSQEYEDLLDEIRAERLAGLIFCFDPDWAVGTPLLDTPGLPAISLFDHASANLPRISLDVRQFWHRAFEHLAARGRRRIAIVCAPGLHPWSVHSLPALAAEHDVTVDETWVQSVDLLHPEWAENQVRLLMRGQPGDRPDGLIVADDNLLDHACRGLIKAGVRVPDDLEVVGHANFPLTGVDVLPVRRLGFDIRQLLTTAMDEIDRLRQGDPVAERVWIPARFADEKAATVPVSRDLPQRADGGPEPAVAGSASTWPRAAGATHPTPFESATFHQTPVTGVSS